MKNENQKLPFDTDKFREIWEEWLTYRREKHLPSYKPTGLKRTLSGLVRDAGGNEDSAIRIIINAMEKSWQGLYPVKENGTVTNQQINQPGSGKLGTSEARTERAKNW